MKRFNSIRRHGALFVGQHAPDGVVMGRPASQRIEQPWPLKLAVRFVTRRTTNRQKCALIAGYVLLAKAGRVADI